MRSRRPVRITPQQRECIQYPAKGHLLVRGIPGSGKTTVLLERARRLKDNREEPVLLITFNTMLTRFIRELAQRTPGATVDSMTYHGWGRQLLQGLGVHLKVVSGKERDDTILFAIRVVNKGDPGIIHKIPPQLEAASNKSRDLQAQLDFLRDEFTWIKSTGKDRAHYLTEPRTGRGSQIAVLKRHKEWIWTVFEKYQSILRARRQCDFDDIALLMIDRSERIRESDRPLHVLVDEAQDLSAMQLRSIRVLARRSLTIAADKGQSIYRSGFSWRELGIDVRGRSKSLTQTHRCTRQIYRLAESLQRHDPLVIDSDDELTPADEPDYDGPVPTIHHTGKLTDQVSRVIDWAIARLNEWPDDTVGIVLPSRHWIDKYAETLDKRDYPFAVLASGDESADILSPGIKLVTYHSAKGLEFDNVACAGLRDGTLPRGLRSALSEEDLKEVLATERRKLFVAMTRAHLSLALFVARPPSQFISELDENLYEVANQGPRLSDCGRRGQGESCRSTGREDQ